MLCLHHRNRYASDVALGADLNGLPVAAGPQHQACGESRSLDEHVDLAAACCTLEIAENIPARLTPVAGNSLAPARNVAAQVEFVAVAGAMQILLQTQPGAVDFIVCPAANSLGRTGRERKR